MDIPLGRSMTIYVLTSGLSGNSLERHVVGLVSFALSPSAMASSVMGSSSSVDPTGRETRQSVSSSAAMSSNKGAKLALIWFLRLPMVSVDGTETGKALEVDSPSTRQNRFRLSMAGTQ